jgi:peroxiredoxin/outer membrane lipoprotein-sorting protein
MRVILLLLVVCVMNVSSVAQTTRPATDSATEGLLSNCELAYRELKSLELAGTLSFELDAAGEKQSYQQAFTASFRAPANFRHDLRDDLMIVSDGRKTYVYKTDQKRYLTADAPGARVDLPGDLNSTVREGLIQQNPSLLAALCKDVAAAIRGGATQVNRGEDVTIDGIRYAVLTGAEKGKTHRILVDPRTHLIRRYEVDLKEHLTTQGLPQVISARVVVDYTRSQPDVPVADASFRWEVPADAMLVKLVEPTLADDAGSEAGQVLVGKLAPPFKLKDLAGNEVSLEALQGNVVVLDFWATWCGPCIQGMPHIDQLHKDLAAQGVKVYAVNVSEAETKVKPFLASHKLTLPVLLDSDGKVSAQYKAPPIPQTFIVGKDGKVRKVFVGYGPGVEKSVREAVESVMKD